MAPGWATMKLACRSETSAPPCRVPFKPGLLDQGAGREVGRRILEDAARRLVAVGLVLLLDDPDPPHPPDDGLGVLGLELELGGEDHRLVEVRLAVGEAEVVAVADLDLAGGVDDGRAADELADRALAVAGIAPQGAADGAGDAGQDLQPGQTGAGRVRDQGGQRDGRPGLDDVAVDRHVGEGRALQVDDHRLDPLVADEHVRAAAEEPERQLLVATAAEQAEQLVERPRPRQEPRRAAQPEPDVRGQRLIGLDDRAKVVE